MKTLLLCIVMLWGSALLNPVILHAEEPFDTVKGYTNALKSGDTTRLRSYIGGHLYKKRKVLLEQNVSYPEFLRNLYERAEFQISETVMDLGQRGQAVKVHIEFPDGNSFVSTMIVEEESSGSWKIVDEIEGEP